MNTGKLIFRHEWLLLRRSRLQQVMLCLFIITAFYAVYYGNAEMDRQQATIQYIRQQNAIEQTELTRGLYADTTTPGGMTAYEKAAYPSKARFFLNYYAINEPTPFARLSIGQRDVYPYYLQLNAQNLYLQLFKTEISNPKKLLAGNFDLAFVFIYLLPLLIIAFTYNLMAAEKELGTFALLKTQPVSIRRIILYKWLFWFLFITGLVTVLTIIGFVWSGIGLPQYLAIGGWLLTVILYTACWFALALLINSCNRSSAFNAMWALGCWLLFLVIIPAVVNLSVTENRHTDATQLTNYIRRRQGMGETKKEKQELLGRFYAVYPAYKSTDSTGHDFLDFQAYSAFVTLLDREAKPAVDRYYNEIWNRNTLIAKFNGINPAVNAQNMLNAISKTGLEEAFDFRESITRFHWQLSDFCFAPLFGNRLMTKEDYSHLPAFSMQRQRPVLPLVVTGWAWLMATVCLLTVIAVGKLKNL